MKKFAMSLMALGAAFMLLAPQDGSASGLVGKGFKVGLNISTLTGDDADFPGVDKKSRVNLAIGGFLTFGLGDAISIQPELMYVGGGANYEWSTGSTDRKLSFLDIPVLVKYGIPTTGNFKPSVYLGPALRFLLSGEDEDNAGTTTDLKDDTKSTSFGLVFGVGANISSVTLDLRYGLGLSSIWEDVGTPPQEVDIKTAGFEVLVGYSF